MSEEGPPPRSIEARPSVPSRRGGPQQIPRPEQARPGPGAPWSRAGGLAPTVVTTDGVRAALSSGLTRVPGAPGLDGPVPDGPVPGDPVLGDRVLDGPVLGGPVLDGRAPPDIRPTPAVRPAAVLCALFDEDGQAEVILTRRSALLRSHTGEVSFPGGRIDPGESAVDAALRETYEEVGIEPSSIEVIGRLSTVTARRNPAPITPFVGILPGRPVFRPNRDEVDRVFTVPVVELYQADVYHEELWPGPDGAERPISFFEVIGDTVWGATGRMLRELLDLIWRIGEAPSASGDPPSSLDAP